MLLHLSRRFHQQAPTLSRFLFIFLMSVRGFSKIKSALVEYNSMLDVPLASKKQITSDTYIYNFTLPNPDLSLGLLPGQHISITMKYNPTGLKEELVQRKYTPVSLPEKLGSFDLLYKVYRKCREYPDGGVMTQLLEQLQVGETVRIAGPFGRNIYAGQGKFYIGKYELNVKEVGFIIGGTGITPAFQIMQKIYKDEEDQTKVYLLFANRSEEDILLKEELLEMQKDPRFKIHFTVDKAKPGWEGFTGYVTKEMIQKVFPEPSEDIFMGFCGPNKMKRIVTNALEDLGYDENQIAWY